MRAGDEPTEHLSKFLLDPEVTHLNHGSFGACPIEVLDVQTELRRRMERNAMQFFLRDLEPLLDDARSKLAAFVGASPEDIGFVTNATSGVNMVLRSLDLKAGDELLTTNHAYNACSNALRFVAERTGARVVVANVPFPLEKPEQVVSAILAATTPSTRLAMVDHVTSQTGLVFPIREIVAALSTRGIDVLVDGAHAPGMVDLDVTAIGAAYYTGNCHKWVCAPKGAAFLHVRRDKQAAVRPLTISHGANSRRAERSRFLLELDWQGTTDTTPALSIPAALAFLEKSWPGGIPALRSRNRELALRAREAISHLLGAPLCAPESMIGSLGAIGFAPGPRGIDSALDLEPLAEALAQGPRIEVPVFTWSEPPMRLLRVSAQIYNRWADYERLMAALPAALA